MKPVGEFLDAHNVKYAVVGSVAGLSHGYGRPTIDVDVLTELREELADEMQNRFEGAWYVDAASITRRRAPQIFVQSLPFCNRHQD